jgi:hypothetical protein
MEGGGSIRRIATLRLPNTCVESHADVDYS